MAILTFTSFVVLVEKGDRPTEQSSTLFPSGQLKLNSFIRESECVEESGTCCSQSILTLENRKDPLVSLVDLWGQVMTLRGQILVSRTDNDTLPPLRVSIQNVPVWTFKTSPCVRAPRAHVSTHVRVVPAYPTTFGMYTRRFFLRPTTGFSTLFQRAATHTNTHTHTKHTPRPPTTPRPQRHTTQHNTQHHAETDRESETEKERQDKTRQEKTIQDKKTREDERGETRRDKRREEKREEKREERREKREERR